MQPENYPKGPNLLCRKVEFNSNFNRLFTFLRESFTILLYVYTGVNQPFKNELSFE